MIVFEFLFNVSSPVIIDIEEFIEYLRDDEFNNKLYKLLIIARDTCDRLVRLIPI